ncbi:MAG TPA: bifunctional adenosylcobinamide kinase/adenosylcobinamide-phosphate guanylyltransferase [Candidatus Nanopelagicales bacterium]
MRVTLLGTGSADRWPNPWCGCPTCRWARQSGAHRNRTSVLVDDVLLVDPGPDAGSGGVDLSGVRAVLITHDHPDHLDPAFLLAWTWAGATPLVVAGPQQALDRCRDWVAPEAPVQFLPLGAGDQVRLAGLQVRALPAAHATSGGHEHDGTALLYEATGDARMLYGTDTAGLPHDQLDGPYDLVLLECTFGTVLDHGTAHLGLAGFGHEVARLRTEDRLADGARVVAVHLSHHNPPDLGERLAAVGAEVLPDGTVLRVGGGAGPGRRLLVTGGARSGKSGHAEAVARGRRHVHYVATAPSFPDDAEWAARVAAHRERRPPQWVLHETLDLAGVLRGAEPGRLVLVDCLALWVTGLVDAAAGWDDRRAAEDAVQHALAEVVDALATSPADVVLVTNEVGSGVVPATASGRLFQDLLGRVNIGVAAACDDVALVTCGLPRMLKGTPWTTST